MKTLVFLLSFLFLSSTSHAVEVYFSPSPDCENRIAKAIENSQKEIVVAVYSINNLKIADALINAKNRGVKVRILTDAVQASSQSSKALTLANSGLDLRLNSKFKIEHNKFAVYDGSLVSTGSFNWTGAAARSNSENCIFVEDKDVVAKYADRFEFLWNINTADGSKSRMQKLHGSNGVTIRENSKRETNKAK